MVNILQIDVEDWYSDLDIRYWESSEDRIIQNTNKVLAILEERDIRATFFILGYLAEHFPQLVRRIKEQGHEIASHGYNHTPITKKTPLEFEEDLSKSIRILEKISGDKVWGYRAPQFTVVEKTSWAIDILKEKGLRYDSSIFPVKTPLYGVPDAPLFPYHISPLDIKKDNPDLLKKLEQNGIDTPEKLNAFKEANSANISDKHIIEDMVKKLNQSLEAPENANSEVGRLQHEALKEGVEKAGGPEAFVKQMLEKIKTGAIATTQPTSGSLLYSAVLRISLMYSLKPTYFIVPSPYLKNFIAFLYGYIYSTT